MRGAHWGNEGGCTQWGAGEAWVHPRAPLYLMGCWGALGCPWYHCEPHRAQGHHWVTEPCAPWDPWVTPEPPGVRGVLGVTSCTPQSPTAPLGAPCTPQHPWVLPHPQSPMNPGSCPQCPLYHPRVSPVSPSSAGDTLGTPRHCHLCKQTINQLGWGQRLRRLCHLLSQHPGVTHSCHLYSFSVPPGQGGVTLSPQFR